MWKNTIKEHSSSLLFNCYVTLEYFTLITYPFSQHLPALLKKKKSKQKNHPKTYMSLESNKADRDTFTMHQNRSERLKCFCLSLFSMILQLNRLHFSKRKASGTWTIYIHVMLFRVNQQWCQCCHTDLYHMKILLIAFMGLYRCTPAEETSSQTSRVLVQS